MHQPGYITKGIRKSPDTDGSPEPAHVHSMRHLCPFGSVNAIISGSMSSSDMPCRLEIRACGKARKNRAAPSRSSIRANCTPRQTVMCSNRQSLNHSQLLGQEE